MAKPAKTPQSVFDKMKALTELINKSPFGGKDHNVATVLGDEDIVSNVKWLKTKFREINHAFGNGIPEGKIIELFGGESAGKSTLVYHILAAFQEGHPDDGILVIDTENSYDPLYVERLGVKASGITYVEAEKGLDCLNIAKLAMESGLVGMVVIDSVAALTTNSDDTGDIGDQAMAEQARMVTNAMRVLNNLVAQHGTSFIITNQVRENLAAKYGDKIATPAGKALKHYAHIRVKLTRIGVIKSGEEAVGIKGRLDVVKNKLAPPFRKAEYSISFGKGIDPVLSLANSAIALEIIKKKGGWFSFEGVTIAQGQEELVEKLEKDKEMLEKVSALVDAAYEDLLKAKLKASEADEEPEKSDGETEAEIL